MRDRGFSIVIGVMLALTLAGCGLEVQNLGIPAQGDNQTEGGLPATGNRKWNAQRSTSGAELLS